MPLPAHFRLPVWRQASWEGFHGMWPALMVQRLDRQLPADFSAEPRVHLGAFYEIDVCAFEGEEPGQPVIAADSGQGGVATAVWAPPHPTLTMEAELPEQYEYEVLVYDHSRGRKLVAAVELVSPANKDRPESRRAFVTKCAALLQQEVCVTVVDLVTTRQANLYAELLAEFDLTDHALGASPPPIYAATCRWRPVGRKSQMDAWAYPLVVGEALPTLPLWLTPDLAIALELEASYEDTCKALRIG